MGAYLSFAQKRFKSTSAYRFDNYMSILWSLFNIFIYMAIYRMMFGVNTTYDGITLNMITTNFVLTFVIGNAMSMDDFFINHKIQDGSIANEFLRPVNLKLRILAENIGETLYCFVFQCIPNIIIVFMVYQFELPQSLLSFVLFIVSLILGYLILWSMSFIVQMSSFFIINVWSVSTIKDVFINVLAGVYLPVWFFPDWLKTIIAFTPFDSIFYLPIEFYFGRLNQSQILFSFAKQIFWIVVLMLIGELLYRKGKRKLIVQGG